MFEGLRKPMELITIVVALLSYGCPVQATMHAFGLDERTVAKWRDRAGQHCQRVYQAIVEQGQLDLNGLRTKLLLLSLPRRTQQDEAPHLLTG